MEEDKNKDEGLGDWQHATRNGHQDARAWYRSHRRGYGPKVNFGRLFLGFGLVFFGFAYLARGLGILPAFMLDWSEIWPLFIIAAGLSLISERGWVSMVIGTLITLAIVALVVVAFATRLGY